MTRATALRARETTPAPTIAALRQTLATAEARRAELSDELRRVSLAISPYVQRPDATPSRAEVLRARSREPELRRDLQIAVAEAEDATRALDGAARAEREQQAERERVRLRPLVREFVSAMEAAAEAHDAMVSAGGPVCVALAPEGGLFEHWRRFARQSGLIEV